MKQVGIHGVRSDECRVVGVPYEARVDALREGCVVEWEAGEDGVANVVA